MQRFRFGFFLGAITVRGINLFFLILIAGLFQTLQRLAAQSPLFSIQEAAQMTLMEDPVLKLQDNIVDLNQAGLRIEKGRFDFNLNAAIKWRRDVESLLPTDILATNFGMSSLTTRDQSFSLGVEKRFNTGLVISPGILIARTGFNVPGYTDFFNFPKLNLSLRQPLLKGMGMRSAAAQLVAAKLRFESGTLYGQFLASKEIMSCAQAYWEYLSAWQSLKIYRENEERVLLLLDITQKLVTADIVPGSNLAQIQAEVAEKTAQRIWEEQRYFDAKLELGRVIGLSYKESRSLGPPADDFPSPEDSGFLVGNRLNSLVDIAIDKRYDIRAIRELTRANEIIYLGVRRDRLPELDLRLLGEYGGYAKGNEFSDLIFPLAQQAGRNWSVQVALAYTFPIQNNVALGKYQQAEIDLKTQKLLEENQIRNAEINIGIAFRELETATLALRKSKEGLELSKTTFHNEEKKYEKGLTTLLNLMLFQERLTQSELRYIQARQKMAGSIVRLRHETGTLVPNDLKIESVSRQVFYTIPQP